MKTVQRIWITALTLSILGMACNLHAQDCTTLAEATHAPAFTWTTGGNANWFAQTNVAQEAEACAAQSGNVADGEQSWIETEVIGNGLATFMWKVSSENGFDPLLLYINGENAGDISGEVNWQQKQVELTNGTSTLRWVYSKDDSVSEGSDTGWMTDFTFHPFTGRMLVATGDLAFGKVPVGTNAQRAITVRSLGDETVTVTDVQVPATYSADPQAFSLAPGETTNVTVTFSPTEGISFSGSFEILSDAQSGVSSLPVSGIGLIVADRFVWLDSPNPTPPFTTWATASHTLQEAIDLAGEGDTVWVTNGVYDTGGAVWDEQTNRAVVSTGIVVRSVNGPAVTHIVGAADPTSAHPYGLGLAAIRGVVLQSRSVLSGFTVRNGHTMVNGYGGGVVAFSDGVERRSDDLVLPIVTNCVLIENVANMGGGICGATCYNSLIISNQATMRGGGAYQAWMIDSIVQDNQAVQYGGGTAYSMADGCRIQNNLAQSGGGVYRNMRTRNCVIVGNTATVRGGGAARCYEEARLENCTVVGNRAPMGGGIVEAQAFNSVIYFNTASENPNWDADSQMESCCSTPLADGAHGTNNISIDPSLTGITFPHLLPDSPCIDAGIHLDWMTNAVDMDGEARLNDIVDIGADELWEDGLNDPLQVNILLPLGNTVTPNYPLPFEADIVGRCQQTWWELEGTVLTNTATFTHVFAAPGEYEVRLTASNLLGVASASTTVTVGNATFYVSPDGSDAHDGTSWATAKQTIQAAVDACVAPGGMVWVTNGVYATGGSSLYGHSNRVSVTRPITIQSVNGPSVTEIQGATDPASTNLFGCGSNAVRCVYLGGGATLSGFHLFGGRSGVRSSIPLRRAGDARSSPRASATVEYTLAGGGVWGESIHDVVSNCVISGCAAFIYGGGASGGRIVQSILENNDAGQYAGGALQSTLSRSIIRNNRARSGAGLFISVATNCLIADNVASEQMGGAGNSELVNCTVVGNRARDIGGVSAGTCVNTIVYHNEALTSPNWDLNEAPQFSYSCLTPLPTEGVGNFSDIPQLSGIQSAHLLPSSPCIGAGITQEWMTAETDCDDEPRLNGTSVDVGWDQFWRAGCTDELSVAVFFPEGNRVAEGRSLPMEIDVSAGHPLQILWDFGDGSSATPDIRLTHAWSALGNYSVQVTVQNDAFTVTVTNVVQVENSVQHVDPSGNDSGAGTNWLTAKKTIQAAVADSIFGGLILVSNGVYDTGTTLHSYSSTSNRVVLTKELTLRSVNGPEVTVIAGQPSTNGTIGNEVVRCVLMTPHTRLEGFSLTNGCTREYDYGGGVHAIDATVVISNCVVTGNQAFSGGGGIYQGTVYNSLLENNGSGPDFGGGGARNAALFDCVVTHNTATSTRGGGIANGSATRCQIIENTADMGGGGTYSTALSNCVVRSNSSVSGYGGGVSSGSAYTCWIVENSAPELYGATYNTLLQNCTVVSNSSGVRSGSALNSILYHNTDYQWFDNGDSSTLEYTCTTPLPTGAGCFTNDPLLDAQGNLTAASPCVNAGFYQLWMDGAVDLAGHARIQNAAVDLGAFESPFWGQHADVDGDGLPDWTEVNVTQTDPTSAASTLAMEIIPESSWAEEGILVRWQSITGVVYNVMRSTNLMETPSFLSWTNGVIGQPSTTTVTDQTAAAESPYFYRVTITP